MERMELIELRLKLIEDSITNKEFLKGKRIAGEVPFYIFDYPPKDELVVRNFRKELEKKLESYYKIKIATFDLFEIYIELLESRGILESVLDREKEIGSDSVGDILISTIEGSDIARLIGERGNHADLIIIHGVGSVFPLIRSHSTLNTLQPIFNDNDKPVLMFFPGTYNKKGLSLFDMFPADHYYRAFKLVDSEVSDIERREIEKEKEVEKTGIKTDLLTERELFIIHELKNKESLYDGELGSLLQKKFGKAGLISGTITRLNRKIRDTYNIDEYIIHDIVGENNKFTFNKKYIDFEV